MKKVLVALVVIFILILIWLGKAGASLSKCFLETSEKYKDYPAQYSGGVITKQEFEKTFLLLREENKICQQQVVKKFLLPDFITKILTNVSTRGKGLP